jgi:hypothetical protein
MKIEPAEEVVSYRYRIFGATPARRRMWRHWRLPRLPAGYPAEHGFYYQLQDAAYDVELAAPVGPFRTASEAAKALIAQMAPALQALRGTLVLRNLDPEVLTDCIEALNRR